MSAYDDMSCVVNLRISFDDTANEVADITHVEYLLGYRARIHLHRYRPEARP